MRKVALIPFLSLCLLVPSAMAAETPYSKESPVSTNNGQNLEVDPSSGNINSISSVKKWNPLTMEWETIDPGNYTHTSLPDGDPIITFTPPLGNGAKVLVSGQMSQATTVKLKWKPANP